MTTRRGMLMGAGAAALPLTGALASAGAGAGDGGPGSRGSGWSVAALRADGLVDPVGLHAVAPHLSWQLHSDRRGARQAAYRIGVASTAAGAAAARFDLWDSGRIEGSRSVDMVYGGVPLGSRRIAYWRVTAWDDRGAIANSTVARWEMGLLQPADWTASWIAAETGVQRADRAIGLGWRRGAATPQGATCAFRLAFTLPAAADVTAMTACGGIGDVYCDGRPLIVPARNGWGIPGPFSHRLALSAGRHVVTIETRGETRPPVAAALVRAVLADGRVIRFAGDAMRSASAPADGWRAAGFDDSGWVATVVADGTAPMPALEATLLRRRFAVKGRIASARLYMTALGLYEGEVNGRPIGDALLRPEFTDYRSHLLYSVTDVAGLLRQGDNVLGAHVADGWYGGYVSPNGRFSFGSPPFRLLAQLEIRYADGRIQTVTSDDEWTLAASPILSATIYDGEHYDARREQPGWSTAAFRPDTRWEKAVAADPATGALVAAIVPPIRRADRLKAKTVTVLSNGASVVDFGQNFTGWTKLVLKARAGRPVTLRYAELLNADGSVDQTNLRIALATDVYVPRGDARGESYEPRFTYHGFRYVQVEGLDAPLDPAAITGVHIRSDLPETGDLSIGSYVPQRLWINSRWSQRSNFTGIPTDCPQRDERLGWMGDAHVFWDAATFNMDAAAFTQRFMRDVRDAQRGPGDFPDIAPNANRAGFTPPGSSPGWADAGVALPWTIWQRYGDTAIVDQNWTAMERFVESIRVGNPDLVWRNGRGNDFADWLALDAVRPGDPTTPKDLVGTAMWKGAVDSMAAMAAATGRDADAGRYRRMAAGLTDSFGRAFVHADGSIGNGSQTGYILALHFDLLPEARRPAAAARLVADIRRRGTLLSTGFLGTPFSLDVLADAGEVALVYDLLLRTQFPSWGYMIARGATTTWERWNSDAGDRSMNSFNHYALGAVVGFLFRRIAGIAPLAPGFAEIGFDPVLDPRVPTGGATYESRIGRISTQWEQRPGGGFALAMTVPANARATLRLPAATVEAVREGGLPLSRAAGVEVMGMERGRTVVRVGAGTYAFATS